MMLVGIIWAMTAPALLLIPFWLLIKLFNKVHWFDRLQGSWTEARLKLLRGVLAAVLVLAPVSLVWQLDHREFVQLCQQQGVPVIHRRAVTDGFFLDDGTANSFGMRYLQDEGFAWMEARSIYKRDEFVRYERAADGKISEKAQAVRTARYEVIGESSQPHAHTSMTRTRIIDTQAPADAQEMAHAAMLHFNGGRLVMLLGAYGSDSFPSAMSDSKTWNEAYYLVRNTLGAPTMSTP
jgi:hypothetical protein